MSSHKGPRSAAKGAETATFLASAPRSDLERACAPGAATGRFFFDSHDVKAPLVAFEAEWAPEGSGACSRWWCVTDVGAERRFGVAW